MSLFSGREASRSFFSKVQTAPVKLPCSVSSEAYAYAWLFGGGMRGSILFKPNDSSGSDLKFECWGLPKSIELALCINGNQPIYAFHTLSGYVRYACSNIDIVPSALSGELASIIDVNTRRSVGSGRIHTT